jgi:hypothetical protein
MFQKMSASLILLCTCYESILFINHKAYYFQSFASLSIFQIQNFDISFLKMSCFETSKTTLILFLNRTYYSWTMIRIILWILIDKNGFQRYIIHVSVHARTCEDIMIKWNSVIRIIVKVEINDKTKQNIKTQLKMINLHQHTSLENHWTFLVFHGYL